jgi:hypothetical protein
MGSRDVFEQVRLSPAANSSEALITVKSTSTYSLLGSSSLVHVTSQLSSSGNVRSRFGSRRDPEGAVFWEFEAGKRQAFARGRRASLTGDELRTQFGLAPPGKEFAVHAESVLKRR